MKICPNCGKENFDKPFCTNCGHDISDVETEEERTIREEKEKQEELERKEREQKQKQAEIERKEREQKEKQEEIERKEREQKRKQAEIERKEREEKERQKRKRKSRLKIIGVLIIIIAILCAGIYFVTNQNNNQSISNLVGSDENTVDELITSNVNTDDVEFKTVDFKGLFRIDLPVDCNFSEESWDTNVGANYSWHNWGGTDYDEIYYYSGYDNLDSILSKFPEYNIKTEGNLVIFEDNSNHHYAVGVQSNDNEFVIVTATHIDELDYLKKSASSIVFE